MTKFYFMSDLHLEINGNMPLMSIQSDPEGIALVAGDTFVAQYFHDDTREHFEANIADFHMLLDTLGEFRKAYFVMGNHEHYSGIFDYTAETLREYLEGTNVTLLDKEFVALNDEWQLFGGTLWTGYNNQDWFAMHAAKDKMNDHTIIKKLLPQGRTNPYGEPFGRFLPHDAYEEHVKTLDALQNGLYEWKQIDKKTIVMTHHAPTFQSVHPRFAGDILNHAYATDLSELIMDNPNVKYWFHGHMHDTHDYNVGECRVLCNPRGYQGYELNCIFDPEFTIEID
jgi:Icc-related predicted phosphoesterase